jgi:hypothetical protein
VALSQVVGQIVGELHEEFLREVWIGLETHYETLRVDAQ